MFVDKYHKFDEVKMNQFIPLYDKKLLYNFGDSDLPGSISYNVTNIVAWWASASVHSYSNTEFLQISKQNKKLFWWFGQIILHHNISFK